MNRRRHDRFSSNKPFAGFVTFDGTEKQFDLLNISKSGVCIQTQHRVPTGEPIRLEIENRRVLVERVWQSVISTNPVIYKVGMERVFKNDDLVFRLIEDQKTLSNMANKEALQ